MEIRDARGPAPGPVRGRQVASGGAAPLHVVWVGPKPAWLETEEAAAELDIIELDVVAADRLENGRHPGRLAAAADLVHVADTPPAGLRAVRSAGEETVVVLDLGNGRPDPLARAPAQAAGEADLVLLDSLFALHSFRRLHPSLASRTALFRRPVDLRAHVPLRSLAAARSDELVRFRREHRVGGAPTILFAGPYTEAGGLDLALEAATALARRIPHVRFAAVPDGEIEPRYVARTRRSGLADVGGTIELSVPPSELPFWYALANVVCLPCRDAVAAEPAKLAAAAGRPFVGSEVEPLAEHVFNNETGFLIPLGDLDTLTAALEALVGDEDEAARLGEVARRRAELELSPASAARRLRRLWTSAAEGARPGCAEPNGGP